MSYITPRVLIQQEFQQLPVYTTNPLPAFIIGPNYSLSRYGVASEKSKTVLGTLDDAAVLTGNAYVPAADLTYDFPNVHAGGDVDPSYTKVFAEAVQAKYFPIAALGGAGMGGDTVDFVVSPSSQVYSNKVQFSNITLQTANGYNRSAFFSNRDVAVGDLIKVTDDLDNTVTAKITALEARTANEDMDLAAQIAPQYGSGTDGVTSGTSFTSASATFTADLVGKYLTIRHIQDHNGVYKILSFVNAHTLTLDGNAGSHSGRTWYIGGAYNDEGNAMWECAHYNNSVTAGVTNTTVVASNTSTAYVGYAAQAIMSDTYTVTVTTGGSVTAARFSVSSASGAFTTKTNVALDTGVLTVDDAGGNSIEFTFAPTGAPGTIAFVAGNNFSTFVEAPVEPSNPVLSGDYTGTADMVYKISVDRGGAFYDGSNASTCARITITASDVDTSSVVLPRLDTAFSLGSFGVQATFADPVTTTGLIAGDIYYVPVFAAKKGAVTIVELSEELPLAMRQLSSYMTAELFLAQSSIQVSAIRDVVADTYNWTQDSGYITINSGLSTTDAKLVSGITPVALPVVAANLYVEHRDLLQDSVTAIDSVRSLADVTAKLGTVHPDNPLAQGVYDAVLNAQNQIVYFVAVATDDLAGYTEAIKISEKSDKVYSFVPLTFDRTIQDAVIAHVNAYSTPEVGRWRIAWVAVADQKTSLLFDLKEDNTPYTATVTDDPAVSGTQYKLLTVAGATFVASGVRPNDTVRLNFRSTSDGKVTYDEYVVDRVRTNTTLVLTKALSSAINSPVKVQVVRNYTKSERAANIAARGGEFNNRRVRCVFPDSFKYGGVTKQGYFLAAGLAGLRSGVVPHQGLTNSEYLGADDLSKVVVEFNQDDLDTMAEQGIWLITQEVIGATPYVRHQLTTDTSGLNTSEDSITTNVDSISYALKKILAPYIGKYNVNIENVAVVRAAIVSELTYRATNTYTARAGNQLVSFTPKDDVLSIGQNTVYKDRIDVSVRLNVPYPLNYVNLTLVV
jgi:hypothetical protein